jgi:hypothetical protein
VSRFYRSGEGSGGSRLGRSVRVVAVAVAIGSAALGASTTILADTTPTPPATTTTDPVPSPDAAPTPTVTAPKHAPKPAVKPTTPSPRQAARPVVSVHPSSSTHVVVPVAPKVVVAPVPQIATAPRTKRPHPQKPVSQQAEQAPDPLPLPRIQHPLVSVAPGGLEESPGESGSGARPVVAIVSSAASSNPVQPFVIALLALGLLFLAAATLPSAATERWARGALTRSRTTIAVTGVSLLSATAVLLVLVWVGHQ